MNYENKKSLKQFIAVITIIALICIVLVACDANTGDGSQSGKNDLFVFWKNRGPYTETRNIESRLGPDYYLCCKVQNKTDSYVRIYFAVTIDGGIVLKSDTVTMDPDPESYAIYTLSISIPSVIKSTMDRYGVNTYKIEYFATKVSDN